MQLGMQGRAGPIICQIAVLMCVQRGTSPWPPDWMATGAGAGRQFPERPGSGLGGPRRAAGMPGARAEHAQACGRHACSCRPAGESRSPAACSRSGGNLAKQDMPRLNFWSQLMPRRAAAVTVMGSSEKLDQCSSSVCCAQQARVGRVLASGRAWERWQVCRSASALVQVWPAAEGSRAPGGGTHAGLGSRLIQPGCCRACGSGRRPGRSSPRAAGRPDRACPLPTPQAPARAPPLSVQGLGFWVLLALRRLSVSPPHVQETPASGADPDSPGGQARRHSKKPGGRQPRCSGCRQMGLWGGAQLPGRVTCREAGCALLAAAPVPGSRRWACCCRRLLLWFSSSPAPRPARSGDRARRDACPLHSIQQAATARASRQGAALRRSKARPGLTDLQAQLLHLLLHLLQALLLLLPLLFLPCPAAGPCLLPMVVGFVGPCSPWA